MNKAKVDFIVDLLSDKKLDLGSKERLFSLASEEVKKLDITDPEILNRLDELENRVNLIIDVNYVKPDVGKENQPNTPLTNYPGISLSDIEMVGEMERQFGLPADNNAEKIKDDNNSKKTKNKGKMQPELHNPKKTSDCLKLFKTGNKLKWITHIYPNTDDSKFDYKTVTQDAISEFKEISNDLPIKIRSFVALFLYKFNSDPKRKHIYYLGDRYETWWSNKIIDWCNKNQGLHPDSNEELSKKIITPFKKGIEIRDGEDLINAIKYCLKRNYGEDIFKEFEIDFSSVLKSTRFFTGVDQLMTGIASIFSPIQKRKQISNKVNISTKIDEIDGQYAWVVEIVHLDSDSKYDFNPSSLINGDLLVPEKEFRSLCDWEVSSNFNNGTFKFNPFEIDQKLSSLQLNNKVAGFTHKLIFY